MTDPVSRASGGYSGNNSEAAFQGALNNAMTAGRGGGRGPSGGSSGNGGGASGANGGGGNGGGGPGNGGTAVFADPYLNGIYGSYVAGGASPVSTETQALIDQALTYDKEANVDPDESKRRWDAARGAIVSDAKTMMATYNDSQSQAGQGQNGGQNAGAPDVTKLPPKLLALNMWTLAGDRRATETQKALDEAGTDLHLEMRNKALDGLIEDVQGTIDEMKDKNGDENWFRQGWDWATGGGAREDFEGFLNGKLDKLKALDQRAENGGLSDAEYASEMKAIMGDFEAQFQKHVEDVADSDGTWNTIGEVGRVVAATAAGIITTAVTGNPVAGFAVGLGTYEVIDLAGDGVAVAKGEDPYADGHVGILTGAIDAAGFDGGNFGMTKDHLKTWAVDNTVDVISSVSTGAATKGGMWTSNLVKGTSWAPKVGGVMPKALGGAEAGTRIVATTAGGVTAQGINSLGYIGSDAARMGYDGKFSGSELWQQSVKPQIVYTAASIPTSAVAGWIPIQRGVTTAGTASAGSTPSQFAYKLNYPGVAAQFANDGVSNFATAWAADGDIFNISDNKITKEDAIGALGGTIPGTLQNATAHPHVQARIDAWKSGGRDLKFTSWTGFPPEGIRLSPITATVLALRASLQGADAITGANATKTANDSAVLATTLRSSASKFAWFNGNHKLVKIYNMALAGDPKAIELFNSAVVNRGRNGIKISSAERAKYQKISGFGDAYANAKTKLSEAELAKEIDSLVKNGKADTDTQALLQRGPLTEKDLALVELEKAYLDAKSVKPREKILRDAEKLIKFGDEYVAAQPRIESAKREIEALVQLGKAYADARAKLPKDQQKLLPELTVRKLTSPDRVVENLLKNENIPDSVRNNFQNLDQEIRLLQHSNIVEGLLTDPEFVINGIQALAGKKLSPAEIENLREIFKTQKLLEMNTIHGGYGDWQPGTKWGDLTWRTTQENGTTKPGIFEEEMLRLDGFVTAFLRSTDTGSAAANAQLKDILNAWQAYVPVYSNSRGRTVDLNALTGSRKTYDTALSNLAPDMKSLLPGARPVSESPQAALTRLRQDQSLPPELREALGEFDPNTFLLDHADTVKSLLLKNALFEQTVDGLKGKMTDAQYDGIKTMMDIHNLLKADTAQGGFNNRQPGVPWNELGWREVNQTSQPTKPGIFDEEIGKLDQVVQDFLTRHGKDASGNDLPGMREFMDAWKGYVTLYSQTQHDLAATDFEPGIKRETAEQKLTSSASPDTKYGYALKAGAYGVAVNLVYSWMLKATPATDGWTQAALAGAYGGEMVLAGYNLLGQIGYMKALGAMTTFRGTHDKAEYMPSDTPADMAKFDLDLHTKYKELEARRAKWNRIADFGSGISATRNTLMGAAFLTMGLPSMAVMSFANAGLSLGWLGMQRGPLQRALPHKFQNAVRLLSIFGGLALQGGVFMEAMRQADKIKDEKGLEGDSGADKLEEFLNWIVDGLIADEDPQFADLNDRHPLGDRA